MNSTQIAEGNKLIQLQGEFLFEFSSKQHWINKAQSWFRPYKGEEHICLDTNGNILTCGEDFRIAEERNLYPVKVYRLIRTAHAK